MCTSGLRPVRSPRPPVALPDSERTEHRCRLNGQRGSAERTGTPELNGSYGSQDKDPGRRQDLGRARPLATDLGTAAGSRALVAPLGDDPNAVGGIHDRLVLLVPAHPVVLMPGLAEDLEDLPMASGLAVDAFRLKHVARMGDVWCLLAHTEDQTVASTRGHPRPTARRARRSTNAPARTLRESGLRQVRRGGVIRTEGRAASRC